MPVKIYRNVPPPVPQPPETFSLEGMSKQQTEVLLRVLQAGYKALSIGLPSSMGNVNDDQFINRVIDCLKSLGTCNVRKLKQGD